MLQRPYISILVITLISMLSFACQQSGEGDFGAPDLADVDIVNAPISPDENATDEVEQEVEDQKDNPVEAEAPMEDPSDEETPGDTAVDDPASEEPTFFYFPVVYYSIPTVVQVVQSDIDPRVFAVEFSEPMDLKFIQDNNSIQLHALEAWIFPMKARIVTFDSGNDYPTSVVFVADDPLQSGTVYTLNVLGLKNSNGVDTSRGMQDRAARSKAGTPLAVKYDFTFTAP